MPRMSALMSAATTVATLVLSETEPSGHPEAPGLTPVPLDPVQHWPALQPVGRELPKSAGWTMVWVSVATATACPPAPALLLAPIPITRAPIALSRLMAVAREGTPLKAAA